MVYGVCDLLCGLFGSGLLTSVVELPYPVVFWGFVGFLSLGFSLWWV